MKSVSTVDLGFSVANKIYVNESVTEKNKELFKLCLKCKRDLSYKFLLDQCRQDLPKEEFELFCDTCQLYR